MDHSRRRILATAAAAAAGWSALPSEASSQGGRGVGVVLLHGKRADPGGALSRVAGQLEGMGAVTIAPEMPWSSGRYLSGTWRDAMGEIAGAVEAVRARGAGKVFLVGHSMGCPASMSYAASASGLAGIVLTAPGHSPRLYMQYTPEIRDSVERARIMVREKRGGETATFFDNNQGSVFEVRASAAGYLSFFDPAGPCEMSNTAGRVRCPAFWVVGTNDQVIRWGDAVGRQLAGRRGGGYLAVPGATHVSTPSLAAAEIANWIMGT